MGKLTFKGGIKATEVDPFEARRKQLLKKKKKSSLLTNDIHDGEHHHRRRHDDDEDNDKTEGWVKVRSLDEMTGPLMFLTTLPLGGGTASSASADPETSTDTSFGGEKAEEGCFSIHCQALTGGVGLKYIEGLLPSQLSTYEPTDTNQVLVAHRTASGHLVKTKATMLQDIAAEFEANEAAAGAGETAAGGGGMETTKLISNVDTSGVLKGPTYEASSQWTFKTSEGRYVGIDAVGKVHIDREAVGPFELWEVILREDGVALKAPARPGKAGVDQYLSVTWDVRRGKAVLRADSDEITHREIWHCFCQAATRQAIRKQEAQQHARKRTAGDDGRDEEAIRLEAHQNKKYQSWGLNRSIRSQADVQTLQKAKEDGRLAEALLDRRAKLKSDKFC